MELLVVNYNKCSFALSFSLINKLLGLILKILLSLAKITTVEFCAKFNHTSDYYNEVFKQIIYFNFILAFSRRHARD